MKFIVRRIIIMVIGILVAVVCRQLGASVLQAILMYNLSSWTLRLSFNVAEDAKRTN